MKLVTGIESQPNFPNEDITASSAEVLELMLLNRQFIEQGHLLAEEASWIYRAGHPAVKKAAERILDPEALSLSAFNHGISIYEAVAATLNPTIPNGDVFTVNKNAAAIIRAWSVDEVANDIEKAVASFRKELPIATELIEQSTERFFMFLGSYSIAGAAYARMFELEATE